MPHIHQEAAASGNLALAAGLHPRQGAACRTSLTTWILLPPVVGRGCGCISGATLWTRLRDVSAVVGLGVCCISEAILRMGRSDLSAVVGRGGCCISEAILRMRRSDLPAVVGLADGRGFGTAEALLDAAAWCLLHLRALGRGGGAGRQRLRRRRLLRRLGFSRARRGRWRRGPQEAACPCR
jgi:hypothetical protein